MNPTLDTTITDTAVRSAPTTVFTTQNGIQYLLEGGKFSGVPGLEEARLHALAGIERHYLNSVVKELHERMLTTRQPDDRLLDLLMSRHGKEIRLGYHLMVEMTTPAQSYFFLTAPLNHIENHPHFHPHFLYSYLGKTFSTKEGNKYHFSSEGRFHGNTQDAQLETQRVQALAGLRPEHIHRIIDENREEVLEEELVNCLLYRYGEEPAPGLHLLVKVTSGKYCITPPLSMIY